MFCVCMARKLGQLCVLWCVLRVLNFLLKLPIVNAARDAVNVAEPCCSACNLCENSLPCVKLTVTGTDSFNKGAFQRIIAQASPCVCVCECVQF